MTDVTVLPKTHDLVLQSGKRFTLTALNALDYCQLEEEGLLAKGPDDKMSIRGILRALWMSARTEHQGLKFEDFARSISIGELTKEGPMVEAANFLFDFVPFTDSLSDTSTS